MAGLSGPPSKAEPVGGSQADVTPKPPPFFRPFFGSKDGKPKGPTEQ
jgi:hypothetical protein